MMRRVLEDDYRQHALTEEKVLQLQKDFEKNLKNLKKCKTE